MRLRDRVASASWAIEGVGSPLLDALVRPAEVVVVAVFVEDALKVVLSEYEDMIETLPSN